MNLLKEKPVAASVTDPTPLTPHILIVDDDSLIRRQLEQLFTSEGCTTTVASAAEQALQLLENEDIDLVVSDIRLPGLDGVDLTKQIVERWGDVPVIIITGYADIENAVEVLKIGASDYIVKPFSAGAIQESARAALQKAGSFAEARQLRRQLQKNYRFGKMISKSPEMHRVFETLRLLTPTDTSVVIEGETGTGKQLVAQTIHQQSPRSNGPLITINCGALPETLLESELFGYERGTFTGADHTRPGKIELAHGGTLFLDEIENMSLNMQAKLLLVLNDQSVQRLGSIQRMRIDMRVIAATNVPLKELLAQGKMRRDFYYRILVVPVKLLPLRRRMDDLPMLIDDFIRHHPLALKKKIGGISPDALDHLGRNSWPGNIRELHNVLEKALVVAKSRVLILTDLDSDLTNLDLHADGNNKKVSTHLPLHQWVREQEKEYLAHKLRKFQGRIDLIASSSGVDVRTIHRKMQVYGLEKKAFSRMPRLRK